MVEQHVTLTDRAAQKVMEYLAADGDGSEQALRLGVRGEGCSGFKYSLAFDQATDTDRRVTDRGVTVLIDETALPLVSGSEIDFVDGIEGKGFTVGNPNVVASCGCGQSFRVLDDAGDE